MDPLSSKVYPDFSESKKYDGDLGPAFARADVPQEMVDLAIKDLFRVYSEPYKQLVAKYKENTQDYLNDFNPIEGFSAYSPSIYFPKSVSRPNVDETRYTGRCQYDLTKLNEKNPIDALLIALAKKLTDHGMSCDKAQVTIEKGGFSTLAGNWHLDSFERSITLCHTNVEDWTTLVLDEQYIMGVYGTIFPKGPLVEQIESLAEQSKSGLFYDANEVLHRSPLLEDFKGYQFKEDDYRLFIRFVKDYSNKSASKSAKL